MRSASVSHAKRQFAMRNPSGDEPTVEHVSHVGRHPSLELNHSVDDKLFIATHRAFLPLRAIFHRNCDSMVCFSESVKTPSPGGKTAERALIFTDKHLYVVSPPSLAFFAPSAAGGCFAWKEYSKCWALLHTNHVLFQFVGAAIAVQFGNKRDVDKCGQLVFSITGAPMDSISESDLRTSSRHFARDTKRLTLSAVEGASQAGSVGKRLLPRVPPSSRDSTASPSTTRAATIENMLQFVLEGGEKMDQMFPEKAVQTDTEYQDIGIQHVPEVCDQEIMCALIQRATDADSGGDDDSSDFEHNDVWRSLGTTERRRAIRPGLLSRSPKTSGGVSEGAKPISDSSPLHAKASFRVPRSQDLLSEPSVEKAIEDQADDDNKADFSKWLSVLGDYQSKLETEGIDSASQLSRMSDKDIEMIMDAVGMQKPTHRRFLASKISMMKRGPR